MKTFIRLAEVWLPSRDGSHLELGSGLFDTAPKFGALAWSTRFARGEGLPGRAWAEGHPILLRQLDHNYFKRSAAAHAAGVTCALALPFFQRGELTSVVLLFFGDTEVHVGAMELWQHEPGGSDELVLDEGYFGSTAKVLETLTRGARLPRGAGLPGLTWQQHQAVLLPEIEGTRQFLRAPEAAAAGIARALSLPCASPQGQAWVLTLLSSTTTPMAKRMEIWRVDEQGQRLWRAAGHCESLGTLPSGPAMAWTPASLGRIGRAMDTGVAQVASASAVHAALQEDQAQAAGLDALLALPVMAGGEVREVVALYF
ncbi:MAG: GAF domain-containing protein [Ramlibacter sp.]|nr:GAF domain-containing protein [Ramlibacter sp.]MCW5648118.1 GAF domain-containing protein [Ramlibacter sp.]